MTARDRQRDAALTDLNHIIALALLAIPDDGKRDAISQARADLLALGVTVPELDAHGIKHDDD
jgi:hypothetical protein